MHYVPLQWLAHIKNINPCLMRWYLALQPYCMMVQYRRVVDHAADFFSQQIVLASLEQQTQLARACVCEFQSNPEAVHVEPPQATPPLQQMAKGVGSTRNEVHHGL